VGLAVGCQRLAVWQLQVLEFWLSAGRLPLGWEGGRWVRQRYGWRRWEWRL